MIIRSLKTKITVMSSAILVLAIGFGTWVNIDFQTRQLRKLTEEKVTILANTIERSLNIAMLEGRSRDVQRVVEMVGTHNKIGVVRVLDGDGNIIRSSKIIEIGTQSGIDMTGINILDEESVLLEDRNEHGEPVLRSLRPILNKPECFHCHGPDQRLNGILEVDVSLAEMHGEVDRLQKTMVVWALAITLALALALSALLSRLVTNPITDLMNTMSRAEEGLDVRAKVASEDELGRLAHSFNSMIIKLNKTKKKVEKLHYEQMRKADRLATVGEMAAGIAHEIKNPLTGIAGVVQILGRDIPAEDPRKPIIKEVLEQIDRLDKAVKNLLSFARPPMPNLTSVNITMLMEKIAAFLTPQFNKNRVSLTKQYTPGLPEISGDPELLQQVFLNIMLNANQAMPDGGEVSVSVGTEFVPGYMLHRAGVWEDRDEAEKEGDRHEVVCVRISDSGKGITQDNMAKIFNPFFTTRQQGTGLGLSITHKIVEQHGGGIAVDSEPGKGTTFIIYLPVVREGITAGAAA
ncbi:MAG: HAMP domain-containing protein [Nitrospirae bacterium]|nr:HAMP domain-containing protein [Nitrospirota bacterium]MBI5695039.1 HAMP domain-containing protein [Nitrospirota bacterium]